jgi:hypothetical protein
VGCLHSVAGKGATPIELLCRNCLVGLWEEEARRSFGKILNCIRCLYL